MKAIDIILLLMILAGAVQGYRSGFVVELFSLIGVFLGIIGGFKLMGMAMIMLDNRFNINEKVLPYLAFGVVFVAIVIIVSLLGRMIKTSLNQSVLGSADAIVGGVLGIARAAFMLSVVIWIADALNIKALDRWAADSLLYPTLARFAPKVTDWAGDLIPFFRDVM